MENLEPLVVGMQSHGNTLGFCHTATTVRARILTSAQLTTGERKQEKEKTDVENLKLLVVGMQSCGIVQ